MALLLAHRLIAGPPPDFVFNIAEGRGIGRCARSLDAVAIGNVRHSVYRFRSADVGRHAR